jgi:hypothetical protein
VSGSPEMADGTAINPPLTRAGNPRSPRRTEIRWFGSGAQRGAGDAPNSHRPPIPFPGGKTWNPLPSSCGVVSVMPTRSKLHRDQRSAHGSGAASAATWSGDLATSRRRATSVSRRNGRWILERPSGFSRSTPSPPFRRSGAGLYPHPRRT